MECLLLASISSKRRHFHYETSLLCVMWLQQKQLMVLTVLQLLKNVVGLSNGAITEERTEMLNSLDEMDAMAKQEIEYQIHQSLRELRFQLTKGHHNLAAIKKKAYFRTITGTLLYQLSVLLGIASDYWTRNWASSATFADVIGRATEEAAYDFQGVMGLNLPDFQCIPDWLENDLPALQIILSREEKDSLTKQKSLIDLAKFRVNAEVGLSCVLQPEVATESRAILGLLDFIKMAATEVIGLKSFGIP